MPKVSFRMASAYCEWVFGVQTNTARKIHRSDHTEGRLTTAPSGCCVRKGTVTGTRRASSTAAEPPRAHGPVSPARCCVSVDEANICSYNWRDDWDRDIAGKRLHSLGATMTVEVC